MPQQRSRVVSAVPMLVVLENGDEILDEVRMITIAVAGCEYGDLAARNAGRVSARPDGRFGSLAAACALRA